MHRRSAPHLIAAAMLAALAAAPSVQGDTTTTRLAYYSRSSSTQPAERLWGGAAWGSATALTALTDKPLWALARNCPKRDEAVVVTVDGSSDVYVQFKSAGAWGTATRVTTTSPAGHSIAVAYEQLSGSALVVYDSTSATSTPYRTASSGSLSAQSQISGFATSNACHTLGLYPKPGTDTILLLGADSGNRLWACFWSGSSWGTPTQLSTAMNQYDVQDFDAVFLPSGDALVAYGTSASNAPSVRTYSGSSWSSATTLTAGSAKMNLVKMAANSSSGAVVLAAVASNSSIVHYTYTGGSWSGQTVTAASVGTSTARLLDVAWTPDRAHCLFAYAKATNNLYTRTFDGSSWSAETAGPTLTAGSNAQVVSLTPGSNGKQIFVMAANAGLNLWTMTWDGSSLGTATQLHSGLAGVAGDEPFAVTDGMRSIVIQSWEQVDPSP